MSKKRLSLIITIVGVSLIIILSVIFEIIDDGEDKNKKYLEKTILYLTQSCIKEKKCEDRTITLNELNSKGYLDHEFIKKLESYSLDSFVSYPDKKVHLIK